MIEAIRRMNETLAELGEWSRPVVEPLVTLVLASLLLFPLTSIVMLVLGAPLGVAVLWCVAGVVTWIGFKVYFALEDEDG